MPEIFGSNIDNHIIVGPTADTFANIRNDDGTGSDVTLGTASDTKNSFCISVYKFMGRGADQFRIHRTFLYFDTSGITGTVSSATLKLNFVGSLIGNHSCIAIKSDAFGGDGSTALAGSDFNNLDFNTPYSSEITGTSTSAYTDITLNSDARSDMQNNDSLIMAIINHDHDYSNSEPPPSAAINQRGLVFADFSSTTRDPKIDYTEVSTATFAKVNALAVGSISKVNALAIANVGKINTIPD